MRFTLQAINVSLVSRFIIQILDCLIQQPILLF